MTYRDIMLQIIAEASETDTETISRLGNSILPAIPGVGKFDQELPADQAEKLLSSLRSNLSGVKRWLFEGGLEQVIEKAKAGKTFTH